jgi:hypothetical protein
MYSRYNSYENENILSLSFDLENYDNQGGYIFRDIPDTTMNNSIFKNNLEPQSIIQVTFNNSEPQTINQITLYSSNEIKNKPLKSQKNKKNGKANQNENLLGRKRKDNQIKGIHTKYKEDNMIRKSKVLFKDSTIKYINKKINEINDNLFVNINGKEYKLEKILDIKQDKIVDINALSNRKLLSEKVKDLLSEDISGRYKNIPKDFNRIAIDKLYEYGNETIISILETNLLDCIKFFRKDDDIINDENFSYLKGLEERYEKLPEELLKDNKNDQEYVDQLIKVIKTFEQIYAEKKPRTRE